MAERYKADPTMSIGECLAQLREHHGLPVNPSCQPYWTFRAFGIKGTLPNFEWRRRAIDYHDLHHLIIGAGMTTRGECTVAAWEFAAGPYPNFWSRAFCFPLVIAGLVLNPWTTIQTIRRGRKQRTLYGLSLCPALPFAHAQRAIERSRLAD